MTERITIGEAKEKLHLHWYEEQFDVTLIVRPPAEESLLKATTVRIFSETTAARVFPARSSAGRKFGRHA